MLQNPFHIHLMIDHELSHFSKKKLWKIKVPFLYAFNADYNELCINKKSNGRPLSLVNYNLNNAYRTLLHVHPLELKDLLVLLKKGSIPSTRHAFYQFLFEANEGDTNESSYRKRVIVLISIRLLR